MKPRRASVQGLSDGDKMKKAGEGWTRDASLDTLPDLDGTVLVIDEEGGYWVKFEVRRVETTSERPPGLCYSLTLHGSANKRLVGFDNAHGVRQSRRPGGKSRTVYDHKHRLRT